MGKSIYFSLVAVATTTIRESLANLLNRMSALLTARRVFLYALALTAITWIIFLLLNARGIDLGHKPGVDFITIYTGAKIARENPRNLYDVETQRAIQSALIPPSLQTAHWHYIYPPYFSIFLMPLGHLDYVPAYWAWTLASALFYLSSICLLSLTALPLRGRIGHVLLIAAPAPAFVWCIMTGQTTTLAFFIWTLTYYLFKREKMFASGFTFGLLAFRFHFLIILGPIFLLKRIWNGLTGVGITALLLFLAGGLMFTFRSYPEYFLTLRVISERIIEGLHPLPKYISLYGFFRLLLPTTLTAMLAAVMAVVLIILLVRVWRGEVLPRTAAFDLQFALTIVATLLLMHHSLVYDLMLLTIPAVAIYKHRLLFPQYYKLILALLYFAPYYSFIIAEKSGVNPVQPLLLWLAFEIYRALRKNHL